MSELEGSLNENKQGKDESRAEPNHYWRFAVLVVVVVGAIFLIARNMTVFGHIVLVALGFGGVVIIHEFGHFIVAKLSGIKVEAFSIFMPPTVLGILKTEKGFRIRILSKFFPKPKGKKEEDNKPDDGLLSFTIGKAGKAGETEYRIGLIPFGGFVKMLGQDDTKGSEATEDPRSYSNKPVHTRMAVISAGVIFNALSAVIAFMLVFLVGIKLPPPVVGGVVPNSPAAVAGLKPGDEIIEIAGKSKDLDFSNIMVGSALSGKGEQVEVKALRDGKVLDFAMVPKDLSEDHDGMRIFGIAPAQTLTIGEVSDVNALVARTGLRPGDVVTAVNGRKVRTHWELADIVENSVASSVTLTAERKVDNSKEAEIVESQIPLEWQLASAYDVKSESNLSHVYSMVPRLRISSIEVKSVSFISKVLGLSGKKKAGDSGEKLAAGDIVVAAGDVDNPTYKEFRDITEQYKDKQLPIRVLRTTGADGAEKVVEVVVVPKRQKGSDRVTIGIGVSLDTQHPVVAKTIATETGPAALSIPRGAVITKVGGVSVSSFYDVAGEIRRDSGRTVKIDYVSSEGKSGDVSVNVENVDKFITVKSAFGRLVPFRNLRRLYKASGPVQAVVMGCRKTVMFIAQTYVTLRRLIGGLVSPKSLLGPVGILTVSYKIVEHQPLIDYVYLLALISACIAVFNFLPLLPFDGGHIVVLLIEKIKGSALSERVQGVIAYTGVVFVIALFLYLTFNDVVNLIVR